MNFGVFVYKHLKGYKLLFLTYLILDVIFNISMLLIPLTTASFIDVLIGNPSIESTLKYGGIFLTLNISQLIISYVIDRLNLYLNSHISFKVNLFIINHLQNCPLLYLRKVDPLYITQRIHADSNAIVSYMISISSGTVANALVLIFISFWLFNKSSLLFIIVLSIQLIYIIQYYFIRKRIYDVSYEAKEAQSNFYTSLQEQITNIKLIKLYNLFEYFNKRLKISFKAIYKSVVENKKISYIVQSGETILTSVSRVALFVTGGLLIVDGKMSIGNFSVLSTYFTLFLNACKFFIGLSQQLIDAQVSIDRINEYLNTPIEENGDIEIDDVKKIEIDNLTVQVDGHELLSNFSYCFELGKIYGIQGANGTGKSTLLNTLVGFYAENYSGKVAYNDVDMREINMKDLRHKNISFLTQKPMVYRASLEENILFGDKSEKNISNLSLFLDVLYQEDSHALNLDTIIDLEGTNVSGGELQKINLIREIVREKEIFILDEPSNNLDLSTIAWLKKYLLSIRDNKIIILVTHDIEMLDIVDEKIVF